MLAEKIKQIAEAIVDKYATVESVAEHIGPWKNDGSSQCELTLRDPDFHDGYIEADEERGEMRLPVGKRRPDYLTLTLARDTVLTLGALEKMFGRWQVVPSLPHGSGHSSIVFYYPNDRAPLSVAVFAEMNGLPQKAATKVTSLTIRRDDLTE